MLQTDEPDDFVISTGETHKVRKFLVAAFKEVDIDIVLVSSAHVPMNDRIVGPEIILCPTFGFLDCFDASLNVTSSNDIFDYFINRCNNQLIYQSNSHLLANVMFHSYVSSQLGRFGSWRGRQGQGNW